MEGPLPRQFNNSQRQRGPCRPAQRTCRRACNACSAASSQRRTEGAVEVTSWARCHRPCLIANAEEQRI